MQIDLAKNLRSNVFQGTLILNAIKWCIQAHFPCTIQAQDCQLLKEAMSLLAEEERSDSVNFEKMTVIMSECPDSHIEYFGKMSLTG